MTNNTEKIFKHSIQEGLIVLLIIPIFLWLFSFVTIHIATYYNLHSNTLASQKNNMPSLLIVFIGCGIVFFLVYLNASKYSVLVDKDYVIVYKSNIEIQRRSVKKFVAIRQSYNFGVKNEVHFEGEPVLILPQMAPYKLRSLNKYLKSMAAKPEIPNH